MFLKKTDAKKFSLPGGTEGMLYPSSPDGDFTVAYVEMDGTYPQKGYSINDASKETLYMIEGEFEVEVENDNFKLRKGDLLTVHPNKKYRIWGKGKAIDLITPAWEKNTNKIIEE